MYWKYYIKFYYISIIIIILTKRENKRNEIEIKTKESGEEVGERERAEIGEREREPVERESTGGRGATASAGGRADPAWPTETTATPGAPPTRTNLEAETGVAPLPRPDAPKPSCATPLHLHPRSSGEDPGERGQSPRRP